MFCFSCVVPPINSKLDALGAERTLEANDGSQKMKKMVYKGRDEKKVNLPTMISLDGSKLDERDQKNKENNRREFVWSISEEIQVLIMSQNF